MRIDGIRKNEIKIRESSTDFLGDKVFYSITDKIEIPDIEKYQMYFIK